MSAPFTQETLNQLCQASGCGEFDLHAACHPRAGLDVVYDKATGTANMACRKCHAPVAEIAVAP